MRQSLFLVAALLALALAPSAALAFDVQTLGAMNPDGASQYADPYADPEEKPGMAPHGGMGGMGGISVTPSLQFGRGTGASVPSYNQSPDNGWQHLAPIGRLTH
jgi:hypothetical protein